MELLTIVHLKRAVSDQRVEACVHAQIDALNRKDTRDGKPFYEAIFSDHGSRMTLRAWSDSPAFEFCENGKPGADPSADLPT